MASNDAFHAMRSRVRDVMGDDGRLEELIETAKRHHARTHHLSGIDGAADCAFGLGTRALRNSTGRRLAEKKPLSSYFIDDDSAMDALFDTVTSGETWDGRKNINVLSRFLVDADVGKRITLHVQADMLDRPCTYGYTLTQDTSSHTPKGAKGALSEVAATSATIVIEKTSNRGDFAVYNMYPDLPTDVHDYVKTPPTALQKKIEATDAYRHQPKVRQIETSLRIYQQDDTPSASVRNGQVWIDFGELGGPEVGISADHMESPGCKNQDEVLRTLRKAGLTTQASAVLQLSKSWGEPRARSPIMQTIMESVAQGQTQTGIA